MARTKPSIIILMILIFLAASFSGWFWYEIAVSLKTSYLNPEIYLIKNLFLPIVPLVIGISFLVILSLAQNTPLWVKWILALTISLPVFFVSLPNSLAAFAVLIMFMSILWIMERIKVETEDHLRIKIVHLAMAGGISQFFTAVMIVISLLAVSNIAASIKTDGIQIPKVWIEKSAPFIIKITGLNQLNKKQNIAQENLTPKNQVLEIEKISKDLGVLLETKDSFSDVIEKFLEQKIQSIFQGSTSAILVFYGLTIFLILSIIRLPVIIIFSLVLSIIYLTLKSIHLIQIKEQTVEAHLPFLGKIQA